MKYTFHSATFDFKMFFRHSSLIFQNFCIFIPAIPGEIEVARESTFFALFLIGESGQFKIPWYDSPTAQGGASGVIGTNL